MHKWRIKWVNAWLIKGLCLQHYFKCCGDAVTCEAQNEYLSCPWAEMFSDVGILRLGGMLRCHQNRSVFSILDARILFFFTFISVYVVSLEGTIYFPWESKYGYYYYVTIHKYKWVHIYTYFNIRISEMKKY